MRQQEANIQDCSTCTTKREELLLESSPHPVAYPWNFSTLRTKPSQQGNSISWPRVRAHGPTPRHANLSLGQP